MHASRAAVCAVVNREIALFRNKETVLTNGATSLPGRVVAWRSGSLHKAIRENITAALCKAERLALSFLRLWVANCQSGGNWYLEQTAAMLPPGVTTKRGRSR
jgi:hypothetical protein